LDGAFASLAAVAGKGSAGPKKAIDLNENGPRIDICPLDDGVSRVLNLWQRLRDRSHWTPSLEEECRQAAGAITLDAPDREKVLALWAEAAIRASADAAEPLSLLSATYPFSTWASALRERDNE
jgi:hypothetical protein